MFYERTIAPAIQKINATFPVLVVTGPRQIGKTTLLTRLAEKDRKIVSLDNPTIRSFAKTDPALELSVCRDFRIAKSVEITFLLLQWMFRLF